MDTVQILKDARALIADEKNWTQGEYARNEQGIPQDNPDQNCVCFCSVGAVAKVMAVNFFEAKFGRPVKKLVEAGGFMNICDLVNFNDFHTHAEVIDLFDRAIALSESEAA